MKIRVSQLRKIIRESVTEVRLMEAARRKRINILKENSVAVVDVASSLLGSESERTEDLFDALENEVSYEDIKSFLKLPKNVAVKMFQNLPDPMGSWLKTWKAADAIVFAREA